MVPRTNWEEIIKMNSIAQSFPANLNIYQKITQYLLNIIEDMEKKDVIFIKNHETIIKFLNEKDNHIVYNIDHHHDCGYLKKEEIMKELTCANWVHYVPNIQSYIWINNSNSSDIPEDRKIKDTIIQSIEKIDLNSLPKPDKIFICYSPPWIPPMYWPLYCLWMDICNKQFNTFYQMHEVMRDN